MERLAPSDLIAWLSGELTHALGEPAGRLAISFLSRADHVEDGTTVLLIHDEGTPFAVALCSAPAAPKMVRKAMLRAQLAKAALGDRLGSAILTPLFEGEITGLTCAVLPYCRPLSSFRPACWLQRAFIRPRIVRWLRDCTERTAAQDDAAGFKESLLYVRGLAYLPRSVRASADRAYERLAVGKWRPRHALMHGDLWKGNILLRGRKFILIDWAGSAIQGYPIYDLVRLASSLRISHRALAREVSRHCAILGCAPEDARSYLLSALGHLGMNLEHFPRERYIRLVDSSIEILDRALGFLAGPVERAAA
jgi:hypothetical protein